MIPLMNYPCLMIITIRPECDQASRSNYQFIGSQGIEAQILHRYNQQIPMGVCIWKFTHTLKNNLNTDFFFFLWTNLQHMEISGLMVKLEPQLQAYTTNMATPDSSPICDLHHSLWQSLIKASNWTHILTDTMSGLNLLSHNRNSWTLIW